MRKGWEFKKLGDLVKIRTGKLDSNAMVEGGQYPFFTCSREIFKINEYAFDCEAILLAGNNASGDFNVKHYKGKFNAYQRTYIITVDEKNRILYKFLNHQLINHLKKFKEQSVGANTKFLKLGMIKGMDIFLPPLTEQHRIVSILDEAFEAIDQAKANTEKNLQNTKELFQSELNSIFTNKGEGWVEKRFGDLCSRVSVGHVGPTTEFYCDSSVGIPFLRSQNVRSGKLDWKGIQYITKEFHGKLKKSQLKFEDILIVRVGANRGDCCVLKEKISELNCANIVFARLKEGNVDFIDRFCQSPIGRDQLLGMSVGSAQGVINTKSVAELIIPYPSIREQDTIVKQLHILSAETKQLEENYRKKLESLEELKKSILQKAFSGELTSPEEALNGSDGMS